MSVLLAAGTPQSTATRLREVGVTCRTVRPQALATIRLDGVDAVVVTEEDDRCRLEQTRPELVGRVQLAAALDRWVGRVRPSTTAPDALRLGVTGYNLKFLAPLLGTWERDERLRVEVDRWPRFRHHDDEDATRRLVARSDVVLCEWCGRNAVIASRHKRPDQSLVVRLHRFELYQPEWEQVEIDAVDTVVTVGPAYRRMVLETTGWPPEKVVVVPNGVDLLQLHREKLPGAIRTLGMIGVDRSRKRLDRALDVLARLRAEDPRWTLRCKGTSPWDSSWVADRPEETAWFDAELQRLDQPPLAGGVAFDPAGPDVAAWLRQVGFLLSTSDDESFHLAPAEGMASGAVPVIWPWDGAAEVHAPRWVLPADGEDLVGDAVARIRAAGADERTFGRTGVAARTDVAGRYRFEEVAERFTRLLLDRAP